MILPSGDRLALELRLVGALMLSPSRYLPAVPEARNGAAIFDPRLRPVVRLIRDTDPNDLQEEICERLETDLSSESELVLKGLQDLADGRSLRLWLGDLVENACRETPETIARMVSELRERNRLEQGCAMLRGCMKTALSSMNDADFGLPDLERTIDGMRDDLKCARGIACPERGAAMADLVLWGADLDNAELPIPVSLVGDGLIVRGGYSLLGAHKGTGKSWEALQLANDIARGHPHWGIPTRQGRVLVFSLELPAATVRERLHAIAGDVHENIGVIGLDSFARRKDHSKPPALPRLADPVHQEAMLEAVMRARADLVVLDPLGRTVRADENEELPAIAGFINDLAVALDVAVFALHHPRKGIAGSTSRGNHHEMRGPSQLTDWAVSLFELREDKGRFVLGHPKGTGPRYCAPMEDVYFERTPEGPFRQIDAPPSRGERVMSIRETLGNLLIELGSASTSDLSDRLQLSSQAVRNHLRAIGARKCGHGNAVVWKPSLCTGRTEPCDNLCAQPEMDF